MTFNSIDKLENTINTYTIDSIFQLEKTDRQFTAINEARRQSKKHISKNLFLYLIIQCSLITYQIA